MKEGSISDQYHFNQVDPEISTRNLLDIKINDLGNNNSAYLIKYQGNIVGFGYTNLYDLDNLKTQGSTHMNSQWMMFPRKIPVFDQYAAYIRWYDGSETKYQLATYTNSVEIKPWAENIWHNTKLQDWDKFKNQNLFSTNFKTKFSKVKSIKSAQALYNSLNESKHLFISSIIENFNKIK